VHHTPATPGPNSRVLAAINREIAALMRTTGDTVEERAARMARYHELVAEYVAVRLGGARGREGEDEEAQAA